MTGRVVVLVNGRSVAPDEPAISGLDRGLMLADGVFETMRVYAGSPFRLDAHLARLTRGAELLALSVPEALKSDIESALDEGRRLDFGDAVLRVTLTRGMGRTPGLAPPTDALPTLIVVVAAMPPADASIRERGISGRIVRTRRNEHSPLSSCKTLSFTDSIAAFIEARAAGADDAILLDTAGHVSEGSASNVFVWSNDVLVTPPLSCGVIPGVTRAIILELAVASGIDTEERIIEMDELLRAREAFLTSSLREVAPLVRVDDRVLGDGLPGIGTKRLSERYSALARGRGS